MKNLKKNENNNYNYNYNSENNTKKEEGKKMKKMKDTTIRKHVRTAYYAFELMRSYENMDHPLAEEQYKREEKIMKKHLSAIGFKKNERSEALNVFAGWYEELTDEELKELKAQAESLIRSTEELRKTLKEVEAEWKELEELSHTEIYDAYVYMRDHEDERGELIFAAKTLVAFELYCRRDAEELEAKLERAYDLSFKGRDEDPDVICFLCDELDSGRTDEAVRIMEEECAEADGDGSEEPSSEAEELADNQAADEYAIALLNDKDDLQITISDEIETVQAQEEVESDEEETNLIIKEVKEKNMKNLNNNNNYNNNTTNATNNMKEEEKNMRNYIIYTAEKNTNDFELEQIKYNSTQTEDELRDLWETEDTDVKILSSEVKDYDLYDVYERYILGDYVDDDGYIHYMDEEVDEMLGKYLADELYAELEGNHYYKNDIEFVNSLYNAASFLD